ncbi:Hypothetical_protein [Hexamita inflata]|uniref:Hypothetical_protein n=1 Tax=Hexamita inflata TaxID=28002 RepID=A0AA86R1L7_9EUKA|nr:Hypothetical protein HINF_LOCUS55077 [Hexamita inflata]
MFADVTGIKIRSKSGRKNGVQRKHKNEVILLQYVEGYVMHYIYKISLLDSKKVQKYYCNKIEKTCHRKLLHYLTQKGVAFAYKRVGQLAYKGVGHGVTPCKRVNSKISLEILL